MLRDRITLGVVSGLIGNAAKNAVDALLRVGKPDQMGFSEMAAGIFIPRREAATGAGRLLGRIADYGLAAVYGIPTVYLLSRTGSDKLLLKGSLMGVLTWGLGLGLARNLGVGKARPLGAGANLRMLLAHVVGGMVTAQAAVSLGDQEILQRNAAPRSATSQRR